MMRFGRWLVVAGAALASAAQAAVVSWYGGGGNVRILDLLELLANWGPCP